MNIEKIEQNLQRIFHQEEHRLVFWFDPQQEFVESVPELQLDSVQILAERHERGSVIITSNLGFADWTQVFGDANLTAALLDRLTHKANIIECTWESYRLQEALRKQQSG